MSWQDEVVELREALRDEHRVTKAMIEATMLMSPSTKLRKLATLNKILASAEGTFEKVLCTSASHRVPVLRSAVTTTITAWRQVQDCMQVAVGSA